MRLGFLARAAGDAELLGSILRDATRPEARQIDERRRYAGRWAHALQTLEHRYGGNGQDAGPQALAYADFTNGRNTAPSN